VDLRVKNDIPGFCAIHLYTVSLLDPIREAESDMGVKCISIDKG
jgi:hypothetical protein